LLHGSSLIFDLHLSNIGFTLAVTEALLTLQLTEVIAVACHIFSSTQSGKLFFVYRTTCSIGRSRNLAEAACQAVSEDS
jgi:hypothetical protein